MISIVMPLFNKSDSVKKSVTSVLQQTYTNFELIIINDGSTDGGEKIVAEISDARLQMHTTKNQGVSAARNVGILKAKYTYIALLDADDWWAPTFLEEIKNAILQFPEMKVFATGRTHMFRTTEILYANTLLPKEGTIGLLNHFQVISKYLPASHASSIVFEKQYFLSTGGFNETMSHFEDHECWHRLFVAQPLVFINKPLSFYNKALENSASEQQVSSITIEQYLKSITEVSKRLTNDNLIYFKKFYRRFAKWSYLKYRPTFSDKEIAVLHPLYEALLSKNELIFLNGVNKAGVVTIYQKVKSILNDSK